MSLNHVIPERLRAIALQNFGKIAALFDSRRRIAGTARDGKPYKITYTWYMQMKVGAIIDVLAFFDTIEFTDFWNRVKPE